MKKKTWTILLVTMCIVFIMGIMLFTEADAKSTTPKPYSIEIPSIPAGFSSYILCVALAEIINKNSSWLRANALEGRGPSEAMKKIIKDPSRAKRTLFFSDNWEPWMARQGIGSFANIPYDYSKFRQVCLLSFGTDSLMVTNPKIKSFKDLEGKKLILGRRQNSAREIAFKGVLKEAGVSIDKLKLEYMRGSAAKDSLKDGLIDAMYTTGTMIKAPDKFVPSPIIQELVTVREVKFFSFDPAWINKMAKETGFSTTPIVIPPKTFYPGQTESVVALSHPLAWGAHVDLPDEVVTEILRIIYENTEKFKEYTPAGGIIDKKTMGSMGVPEKLLHPAAVKFYKEKGIPITGF